MSETISVRFDILHAYAEKHGIDYNDLCRMVRDAIAEGSLNAKAQPISAPTARALKRVAKGETAYSAAKAEGIALSTIYRALKRAKEKK